jgi:hypothetical protein
MSLRRSMLASVAGEKPGRPQFVGVAEVLRLPVRQRHQPCLGLQRDRRFPAGARAIVECSHRAFGHGALDATLDGLMMQSESPTDRKKRRVFPIGQQYPRRSTGSPAPFAIALSISTSPYPHLRATIQSPAATLP